VNERIEVRGRVTNVQGMAVSGAIIVIVAGSVPVPEVALLADTEGRFSLRLPRGRFTLAAHDPAGGTGEAEVEVSTKAVEILITVKR